MKNILLALCLCPTLAFAQVTISLVQDIEPGTVGGQPRALTVHNGALYMYAGANMNRELYKYDGSCVMVQDVNPTFDLDVNGMGSMLSYNGILYLNGNDGVHGMEMMKYDGSTVSAVSDIFPGTGSANSSGFTVLNNKIYFFATETVQSEELWGYDPATNITAIVHDEPSSNMFPQGFTVFNNKLYFTGFDAYVGQELRCYDPANNSYILVQDIYPGFLEGRPTGLIVVGSKLYFSAKSDTHGRELYSYTGTGTPTRLTDIFAGTGNGVKDYSELHQYGDALYFTGDNGTGEGLYKYDLQSGAISMVYNREARDFCNYGSKMYFNADYSPSGIELCVYDGTSVVLVEDLKPGPGGSFIQYKTIFNNEMYFSASTNATGPELYKLTDPIVKAQAYEKEVEKIMLYPNPADDNVTITSGKKINTIEVLSMTGQMLFSERLNANKADISLAGFASGDYVIKLNGSSVYKVVKK